MELIGMNAAIPPPDDASQWPQDPLKEKWDSLSVEQKLDVLFLMTRSSLRLENLPELFMAHSHSEKGEVAVPAHMARLGVWGTSSMLEILVNQAIRREG